MPPKRGSSTPDWERSVREAINSILNPPKRRRQQVAAAASAAADDFDIPSPPRQHPRPPPELGMRLFANKRDLPNPQQNTLVPLIPTNKESNFYLYPKEILDFLYDDNRQFVTRSNNILNLSKLIRWIGDNIPGHVFEYKVENWERRDDPIGFVENELVRLLQGLPAETLEEDDGLVDFFPAMTASNDTLRIPTADIRDLPVYLMLFILYRLGSLVGDHGTFTATYSLSVQDPNIAGSVYRIPLNDRYGHPVQISNGKISMDSLREIYIAIMKQIATIIPNSDIHSGRDEGITWNGSEDSGTRIMLRGRPWPKLDIDCKIDVIPVRAQRRGGYWTQQVEDLINATLGGSVLSVRNRIDNKCLVYCIVMGLILKVRQDGDSRIFGNGVTMVDDYRVYCTGMYRYMDDSEVSKTIRRLSRCLLKPGYSTGDVDELVKYVDNIDKKAGSMVSIAGFREGFREIEEKLVPDYVCGIDVYGIDYGINRHVYPLYISRNRENVIPLLCITPPDSDTSHYALIMNMEKLMARSGGKQFFSCAKCGQAFYHRRLLLDHKCVMKADDCIVNGEGGYHYSCVGVNPDIDIIEGSCPKCRLCFTTPFQLAYHKKHCFMSGKTGYRHVQLVTYKEGEHPTLNGEEIDMEAEKEHVKHRRIMYADFECSIDPETGDHHFMSYGIYDWKTKVYKVGYSLETLMSHIVYTAYSGKEDQIYIYFHNAMNYDANFILRHVMANPEYERWGIQVIMKSSNRLQKLVFYVYRTEGKREVKRTIHIADTFLFLTLSLERIVGSIRKDDIEVNKRNFSNFFRIFRLEYPNVSDSDIDHILRKNVFPYKFFTHSLKLDTPIEEFRQIFEPKEENLKYFSDRVTLEDLDQGYPDTCRVFDVFKCKSARDYHDLYLMCDVMQLADVFNRSMEILWESHHIHLTRYLGMPSASWAAFLRHDPKMSIPLYEDTFFAEFFKAMIRGGITSAALRHAVADEDHSIIYLDVNGLYPYVMQKYKFPCGYFRHIPLGWRGKEYCNIMLQQYFKQFETSNTGMCFCVDMHIPDSVKKMTDMYPFAPEHRRIYREYYRDLDKKELTPYLKRWSEANNGAQMVEFTGLVCTLYDKTEYNVHWRLLKFYLEHGVEITRVYFAVSFQEGDYLAGYIRKNIAIRNTRKDELGKTLYKLLGNSIYGKTFESPFKRNTYEIVRDGNRMHGLLEEGSIASLLPIDNLGWIVKMEGEDIVLNKPTYIGACVCEFSKLHMYTLLYDKLMKMFPGTEDDPGCQLVYTDTDSFIVRVRHPPGVTRDPKTLFAYMKEQDPDLIGGIGGQVKSETGENDTIEECIALRSKVYAYKTYGGLYSQHAKGTTHEAQETQLDWEAYKHALESLVSIDTRNVLFVRKTFKIASLDVYRQSLSVNDGKRYICDDGIHTHAFGY